MLFPMQQHSLSVRRVLLTLSCFKCENEMQTSALAPMRACLQLGKHAKMQKCNNAITQ